ncbi:glycosyltransferase [Niabella sp. W65]|nr:glycosyltransferase [Niabella sp. W65]MCH7365044.1 glycosyltransferase [Niabella sp. W65]
MCKQLKNNGVAPVLIDNSEEHSKNVKDELLGCKVIIQGENIGIARAQNVGITYALAEKADVLIFFDQDSEIQDGFIRNLLKPIVIEKPMIVAPIFMI